MNSLLLGVVAGLAAAFFSSLSFLVARHHGSRHDGTRRSTGPGGPPLRLLGDAHLLMGAVCLPLAWVLWPAGLPLFGGRLWTALLPIGGSTLSYLLGQACMFILLRRVDASRVAPLLGLKVVMLAGITTIFMDHALDWQQWTGVCLSAAAALALRASGGVLPALPTALILLACFSFSISDLCIVGSIDALSAGGAIGRIRAGAIGMAVTYALCGCLMLPLAGLHGRRQRADWLAAAEYGAAWLASMVGLYACFGLIGAVFGNVMQSTRGLMSVMLGAVLAQMGWHDLEQRIDRGTLLRRAAAAVLMTAAIAMYVLSSG